MKKGVSSVTKRSADGGVSRRSFLSGLGAFVLTTPAAYPLMTWAAAPAGAHAPTRPIDLNFRMFWKRKEIGIHRVSVRPEGEAGSWRLATDIDLEVKVFIVGKIVFKHHAEEVWRNGRIMELKSETQSDGKVYGVSGRAEGNDFALKGPAGPYLAPGSMLTTNSLWTESVCAQRQLIDATNGSVIGLVTKERGAKSVATEAGASTARAYDVVSPLIAGEFWFNDEGVWTGGVIEKSGQKVNYVSQS